VDTTTDALVRELNDRQEIYDCVMRYCRGIDRLDRAMLVSAYHPDAVDDHGTFVGPVDKFWDYVHDLHFTHQHRTQHHITNHRCDIDGDTAQTESYYIFRSLNKAPPLHTMASGRYLDRFERRDGRWAIAARVCLVDIRNDAWAPTGFEGDTDYMPSRRDTGDASYLRPLTVDPARFTV
jgi:SnoaL-like domain